MTKVELNQAIARYIRGFEAHIADGKLTMPSGGDCYYCVINSEYHNHLLRHMTEGYYVPSLLWNALADAQGGQKFNFEFIQFHKDTVAANLYLRKYFRRLKPALVGYCVTIKE